MLYKRRAQATDMTTMSAEEQAKELREAATKHGAVLLDDQEDTAMNKLLRGIKSGEIQSVIVLDKDHGDIDLEKIESVPSDFEITML